MQHNLFEHTNYRFFSLGSGSSGNCYYLGTRNYGILIDAGIGIRTIKKTLREYGVAMEKIVALLITHDHADHVKTSGILGDKLSIPVYATQSVHEGIKRNKYINASFLTTERIIQKEVPFEIRDFKITAFEVPHDSIDNVGYKIEFVDNNFVLITDVGHITDTIRKYATNATHLVVEANYDASMLQTGSYPHYLKKRISCGTGHLSNHYSAEFVASIYHENLKNIWLCHLSQDNNHPEIAFKAIEAALYEVGVVVGKHVHLDTLSRYKPSGLLDF